MDTFTTIVEEVKDGVTITTIHDQTGSAAIDGFTPFINIPKLIEQLQEIVDKEDWEINVMPKIQGKSFHCQECGSNMFSKHKQEPTKYKCQGCNAIYHGI